MVVIVPMDSNTQLVRAGGTVFLFYCMMLNPRAERRVNIGSASWLLALYSVLVVPNTVLLPRVLLPGWRVRLSVPTPTRAGQRYARFFGRAVDYHVMPPPSLVQHVYKFRL